MRIIDRPLRFLHRIAYTWKQSLRFHRQVYIVVFTLFTVIGLVTFYHDESYEISKNSLQSLNDKISTITTKIDSWNDKQEEQANDISPSSTSNSIQSSIPSVNSIAQQTSSSWVIPLQSSPAFADGEREITKSTGKVKGVILIVCRNSDLEKLQQTVRSIEERFNRVYKYDIMIVSDSKLSPGFMNSVSAMTSANIIFHNIPKTVFAYPPGLDKSKLKDSRANLRKMKVSYTKTQREKHTQRFWSKEIFNLDPLKNYDYYMKIQPGALFYCDISFDIFKFMSDYNKTFGFSFALKKEVEGFPSMWENVLKYIENNPNKISKNGLIDFISNDKGYSFNGCQLRSSFEVGKLSFFQGIDYQDFAGYLDKFNGIYYEAWDDSTFHTLGVSLLVDREEVQFFNNLGYDELNRGVKQNLHKACPSDKNVRLRSKCTCDPLTDVTWDEHSCIPTYFDVNGFKIPEYIKDLYAAKQKAEEAKKEEDEKKKYEAEELAKEKAAEEEEKKTLFQEEENRKPQVQQQEGEPILPGED